MPDNNNTPFETPQDHEPHHQVPPGQPRRRKMPTDGMTKLSLACGIASFVFMMVGGSLVFGSLGIVFSLLARTEKMPSQAKAGLFLSVFSLAVYLICLIAVFYILSVTGTLDTIMTELSRIDMSSVNAYADAVTIIEDHIIALYNSLLGQVASGTMGGLV